MNSMDIDEAITRIVSRVDHTASVVTTGFPHYADTETGVWQTSPGGDWTGGHWIGQLWLALNRSGDERYRGLAHKWMTALEARLTSQTVFRGFLFWYGAAVGSILTGDERARDLAIRGAQSHASAFNPVARAIPLGSEAEEASDVGDYDANIDCVAGSALLVWASEQTQDDSLRIIGIQDALRHIDFCVRADGSVCQSARFDSQSGEVIERYTHKGYAPDSTWTRAQAWAMLGYAMCAAWVPEQPKFLETAMRTADWWITHAPDDRIAYWDFNAPQDLDTPRDSSGTAIAAAAMAKLSVLVGDQSQSIRYQEAAEATAQELVRECLTPIHSGDRRPVGILTEGCYNIRIGLATNNELVWGDYYLLEALSSLGGYIDPRKI